MFFLIGYLDFQMCSTFKEVEILNRLEKDKILVLSLKHAVLLCLHRAVYTFVINFNLFIKFIHWGFLFVKSSAWYHGEMILLQQHL